MTGARPEGPPNGALLEKILGPEPGPFALLHRPEANGPGLVDILVGEVSHPKTLSDIPLPEPGGADGPRHDVLALVPYRQIAERGFAAHDDGTPLVALSVTRQESAGLATVLAQLPEESMRTSGGHFDVDDDAYAETVRRVIADEIGTGEGANFVIKRTFTLDIGDYCPRSALTLFKRLLEREKGAYWTFVVHTGTRTLVGATPERHISVQDGTAVMNPISGTYRYPAAGPTLPEVMDFLADAQGDRRAVHGGGRGTEDDGPDLPGRRPGERSLPQGDGPPGPYRVLHRRTHRHRPAGGPARDDVRADGHRFARWRAPAGSSAATRPAGAATTAAWSP